MDIAGRESSPGVRRMEAVVGSNAPFGRGCEPLKVLAGLEVTAKAIERTAEGIGADIAKREQQEVDRAKQLVFPLVYKQNIPKMYVLMDGTGVPLFPLRPRAGWGKSRANVLTPGSQVAIFLTGLGIYQLNMTLPSPAASPFPVYIDPGIRATATVYVVQ